MPTATSPEAAMSKASSGGMPSFPLLIVIVAMFVVFVLTSYWYFSSRMDHMSKEINDIKQDYEKQIKVQQERIAEQQIAVAKTAEQQKGLNQQIEVMEGAIETERVETMKVLVNLMEQLRNLRSLQEESNRRISLVNNRFEEVDRSNEQRLSESEKMLFDTRNRVEALSYQVNQKLGSLARKREQSILQQTMQETAMPALPVDAAAE